MLLSRFVRFYFIDDENDVLFDDCNGANLYDYVLYFDDNTLLLLSMVDDTSKKVLSHLLSSSAYIFNNKNLILSFNVFIYLS